MKAIVVYESLWGNTAAIARAIAEGIGAGAQALSTAEAATALIAEAGLIVAGAPLLGFSLPSETMRQSIRSNPTRPPEKLSTPTMRSWLAKLPAAPGNARYAAFETRLWWSPGSSTKTIGQELERAGYREAAKAMRFIVTGTYGPLKPGELDRARAWGAELARVMGA
jgi:flavorubredoxin